MLFLSVRLAIMFSSEKLIWHGEETYAGVVTKGIMEGWATLPLDFPQTPYFGGTAFNAIVAFPFFILFGPTIFALRLTSTLFHALGLIFLFLLFSRYFSVRAALFVSCFYIFSPPLLTARSFIFNGGHAETAVFDILILFVFFELIYRIPSKRNYSLLGFLSGFSLWYAYSNLITIISYTVAWFIRDKMFFINKKYLVYCVSFILGFTPWFIFNLRNKFLGLDFITNEYSNMRLWRPWEILGVLRDLIFKYGYKIFMFDWLTLFWSNLFNISYYLIFTISFSFILLSILRNAFFYSGYYGKEKLLSRGSDNTKEITIITFPLVFIVIYALSNRHFYTSGAGIVDYRYFIILLPFMFMTIALCIEKLFASRNNFLKTFGGLVFVYLIIIGVCSNSRFVYSRDFSNYFLRSRAYDYKHVGVTAFRRFGTDNAKVKSLIERIREEHGKEEAYFGYGEALTIKFEGIENLKKYIELSSTFDSELFQKWFFWGVGEGIIEKFYTSQGSNLDNLRQTFLKCDTSDMNDINKNYLYFGMLARLSFMRGYELNAPTIEEIIKLIAGKYRKLAYMYYGLSKGVKFGRMQSLDYLTLCEDIESPYRKYCYFGVGAGITDFFSCDPRKTLVSFDKFPKDTREFLLQGTGLYFYKISNFDRDLFERNIPPRFQDYKTYLRKGIDIFQELVDPNL